ncbi:MAG: ribosomal protein S18-alanine N-acetyltransferase [Candidatus Helarchaeota archaeon]
MDNNDKIKIAHPNCSYRIRPASLKDLDEIYQIELMSFKDAYPISLLHQLLRDHDAICLIIEVGRKVVGFAFGLMRSENRGHIISVAVHPHYRNCHFGTTLVDRLISALKQRGARIIALEVRISNKIAQKLYRKFRFQIQKTKYHYYSDGENAYFMVLKLNS